MSGMGMNWTEEQVAWLRNEAPSWAEAQRAHVQEVADREADRRAAYLATNPQGPFNDDQIRQAGGYLLMDPQWVVSEWPGVSAEETNTPEWRRNVISMMAENGSVLPFTRDSEIAGYFPAASGVAGSAFEAIGLGNGIVAGTHSPGQYVRNNG